MAPRNLPFWSQIALLLACASAQAMDGPFDSEDILEVTMTGPLRATLADTKDRKERPFVFSVGGADLDVAVRVRGNSRVEACRFPPLRLRFHRHDPADLSGLSGQGALKLVTHCGRGDAYQQNTLEEFAAYRIFGLLTDVAFRVRLLRIRYVDTDGNRGDDKHYYAFLIEPAAALAARVNGSVDKLKGVYRSRLEPAYTPLTFVFQYLIGNTDWGYVAADDSKYCCHNGIVLEIADRHYVVPYDFDQAGIVNARYAEPHPALGLRTVKSRLYRGNCIEGLDIEGAVQATVAREEEILDVVRNLPAASDRLTRARTRYLQEFFDEARDPKKRLAADFHERCVVR